MLGRKQKFRLKRELRKENAKMQLCKNTKIEKWKMEMRAIFGIFVLQRYFLSNVFMVKDTNVR